MTVIRPYSQSDATVVSTIAAALGQTGVVSADNPQYVDFISESGAFWLAQRDNAGVVGFAGVVDRDGATYLTDLFVDPNTQSQGYGRALLEAAWGDAPSRMTSSSQDPRALASYVRFGARPLWPHVYLELDGLATTARMEIIATPWAMNDCGWNWSISGMETITLLNHHGELSASAVVMTDTDRESTRLHVLRAITPEPFGLVDLVSHLRSLVGPDGLVQMTIPGPHQALSAILQAGARIMDVDIWCATDDVADVIDPTRDLPSPAFG